MATATDFTAVVLDMYGSTVPLVVSIIFGSQRVRLPFLTAKLQMVIVRARLPPLHVGLTPNLASANYNTPGDDD